MLCLSCATAYASHVTLIIWTYGNHYLHVGPGARHSQRPLRLHKSRDPSQSPLRLHESRDPIQRPLRLYESRDPSQKPLRLHDWRDPSQRLHESREPIQRLHESRDPIQRPLRLHEPRDPSQRLHESRDPSQRLHESRDSCIPRVRLVITSFYNISHFIFSIALLTNNCICTSIVCIDFFTIWTPQGCITDLNIVLPLLLDVAAF